MYADGSMDLEFSEVILYKIICATVLYGAIYTEVGQIPPARNRMCARVPIGLTLGRKHMCVPITTVIWAMDACSRG